MEGKRAYPGAVLLAVAFLTARAADAQTVPPPPPSGPPVSPPSPAPTPPSHEPGPKDAAAGATPAPAITPVPAPTPSEMRYRRMPVWIESSRPSAILERRVSTKESSGVWFVFPTHSSESTWEQVCVSPCDGADLDRYSTYRVAKANRISGSPPFTLPQDGKEVHLRLDAKSLGWHHVGLTMTSLGGAAIVVGTVMLAGASSLHKPDDTRLGGAITLGAGALVFGLGLPLSLLTNTRVYADNERRVATGGHWTAQGYVF